MPTHCDLCKQKLRTHYVDGKMKTNGGSWAYMCPSCFHREGVGLGIGKGTHFTFRASLNLWVKTHDKVPGKPFRGPTINEIVL